jgi:chromosome segregation ATPase
VTSSTASIAARRLADVAEKLRHHQASLRVQVDSQRVRLEESEEALEGVTFALGRVQTELAEVAGQVAREAQGMSLLEKSTLLAKELEVYRAKLREKEIAWEQLQREIHTPSPDYIYPD